MPGQLVATGSTFIKGIRSEALVTYKRNYATMKERLGAMMDIDIASDRRSEDYFFFNSAPHLKRWIRGEAIPNKAFGGVKYSATNHKWAQSISAQDEDIADDQTKDLMNQARELGQSAAILDERVAFQIFNAGTDNDLLPSVPNAPDGLPLHTSNLRFGYASGNQFAGNMAGLTVAGVQTDFFTAQGTFRSFQDTEGQPLFGENIIDGPTLVVANALHEEFIVKAFLQGWNQGFASQNGITLVGGQSNAVKEGSYGQVAIWMTQRITTAKMAFFKPAAPVKPLFSQMREPLQEIMSDHQNSDEARTTGRLTIHYYMRKGYGVHTAYGTIRVG